MRPPSREKIAAMVAIVFGALLIFAMIRAWYSSRMLNYFAAETKYQGSSFRLGATVPSLMWLVATNYLIRTLSLTILSPIAEARSMRYIVDRLVARRPDRVAGDRAEPGCPAHDAAKGWRRRSMSMPSDPTLYERQAERRTHRRLRARAGAAGEAGWRSCRRASGAPRWCGPTPSCAAACRCAPMRPTCC